MGGAAAGRGEMLFRLWYRMRSLCGKYRLLEGNPPIYLSQQSRHHSRTRFQIPITSTIHNHSTSTCPLTSSSTFCTSPSQSPTHSFTILHLIVAEPLAETEPDAIEDEMNVAL